MADLTDIQVADQTKIVGQTSTGEETNPAKRCGLDNPGEGGCKPLDDECASPNPERGKPCRPRYANMLVANLPNVVKPASQGKERTKAPWGLAGVERRGATQKELPAKRGDPAEPPPGAASSNGNQ